MTIETPANASSPVDEPKHADETQASFLARSKKAVAGAIAAGVTAGASAIAGALADGVITTDEWWSALGLIVGGAAVGFAGVWAAPKNK